MRTASRKKDMRDSFSFERSFSACSCRLWKEAVMLGSLGMGKRSVAGAGFALVPEGWSLPLMLSKAMNELLAGTSIGDR